MQLALECMQQKQQAINSELSELLKIAETKDENSKEVVLLQDDLFSFLQTFNIKTGEELVLKSVLYDLYKSWSKEPIPRINFGHKIGKYLIDHRRRNKAYYKVNRSAFDLNKELLLFLEKTKIKKYKQLPWRKHFEAFLKFYEIKEGKKWVESIVLKHLYNKWCFENRKKSLLSENQLLGFLRLYFKAKRNGSSRMQWFGLNEEFVNKYISKAMLSNLMQHRKKTNDKKQKAKSKISSTKT